MSEETAPYPSPCAGCARPLAGPVAHCPYCGARHEVRGAPEPAAPAVEVVAPFQPVEKPKPEPEPGPFVPATPKPEEAPQGKDAASPPPSPDGTPPDTGPGIAASDTPPPHAESNGGGSKPLVIITSGEGQNSDGHSTSETDNGTAPKNKPRRPLWQKLLAAAAVCALAWLLLAPGEDKAVNASFKEAQSAYSRRELGAARQGLERVLAKKPAHAEAKSLLAEVKLRQQQVEQSLDHAEKLLEQGALAKAQAAAQAALAADSGSTRAGELLARINQQSDRRGNCLATANLAYAAIQAQNLDSAREQLAAAQAAGCKEAASIKKALDKAEPTRLAAPPKPQNGARVDLAMALMELEKAMGLVQEGNWKTGREKAESIRALSGNDPTIQSAVERVLRAAEQERAAQSVKIKFN